VRVDFIDIVIAVHFKSTGKRGQKKKALQMGNVCWIHRTMDNMFRYVKTRSACIEID
jgi:hypothetical protein